MKPFAKSRKACDLIDRFTGVMKQNACLLNPSLPHKLLRRHANFLFKNPRKRIDGHIRHFRQLFIGEYLGNMVLNLSQNIEHQLIRRRKIPILFWDLTDRQHDDFIDNQTRGNRKLFIVLLQALRKNFEICP
jgi:hypothetical protein